MNSNSNVAVNQVTPESLPALSYDGKAVVTTALLAKLYGTEAKHVQNNYGRHKDRFESGKHFYKIEGKELSDLRPSLRGSQISAKARSVILWTERGAARHAKMLETDAAWDVFEKLEDHYFGKVSPGQQKALPSPLTPSHQREVQKAIASRVYMLPEPIRPAAFKRAYSKLKDRFEVGTYKDIDDSRYMEVLDAIESLALEGELLPKDQPEPIRPVKRLNYSEDSLLATGLVDPDGRFKRWANCGPVSDPMRKLLTDLRDAAYNGEAVIIEDVAGAIGMYHAMVSMIANDTELMMGLENHVSRIREASRARLMTSL